MGTSNEIILHPRDSRREEWGRSRFLEIGPGADAKLTHYILSARPEVAPAQQTSSSVTAIESNHNRFEKARVELERYNRRRGGRATVILGDALTILPALDEEGVVRRSCYGNHRLRCVLRRAVSLATRGQPGPTGECSGRAQGYRVRQTRSRGTSAESSSTAGISRPFSRT